MASRRKFVKKLASGIIAASAPSILTAKEDTPITYLQAEKRKKFSNNDNINLGVIGMGIQGNYDLKAAIQVPGVKFVAACDLYQGRLDRTKEVYGKEIFTTRNYKELLARKDIDAVIIATADHWHDRISIEAMEAGKAVYCEKPMVHKIEEGLAVIKAEKETGMVYQVGSQGVSSLKYAEAKKMIQNGDIGEVVMVEAWNDRQSSTGAWNYSIPTDASQQTVDWDTFLGSAPKRDFDPVRFFRWRNYQDYGTGVAGDLFVHLFSGLHVTLDSLGPERIFSTGGLRYWKDGRDVPDVMMACVDYPKTDQHAAFNFMLRINFISGKGGGSGFKIYGTEGILDFGWRGFTLTTNKMAEAPGHGGYDSLFTFTEAQQEAFEKDFSAKFASMKKERPKSTTKEFKLPEGYSDHVQHFTNFFDGIREGKAIVEDASFGLRAAAPSLAANMSYFENKVINWNPVAMNIEQ